MYVMLTTFSFALEILKTSRSEGVRGADDGVDGDGSAEPCATSGLGAPRSLGATKRGTVVKKPLTLAVENGTWYSHSTVDWADNNLHDYVDRADSVRKMGGSG